MKNLLKLSFAIVLVAALSCSSDDTPPVIPTVSVSQDRNIVEPGDEISFTSTAVDADSYLWDFGDGTTSTDANPTHTYSAKGSFTIGVTVTSTTGDTAESTASVTVGSRWVVAFTLSAIPATDPDGKPWDDDASGPDLFFGYSPATENTPLFEIGTDLDLSTLPLTATINPASQSEFTDVDWVFVYLDDDEPFQQFVAEEVMGGITANPVTQESTDKDFTEGTGSFTLSAGGFEATFLFEIRNQ